MGRLCIAVLIMALSGLVSAHQFTPTYPKLTPSFVEGLVSTQMTLFNKRSDVEYYELSVFDKDWNEVPFATTKKIIEIQYLETKQIDIYIRNADKERAVYICSRSKLKAKSETSTLIASRICSKIK